MTILLVDVEHEEPCADLVGCRCSCGVDVAFRADHPLTPEELEAPNEAMDRLSLDEDPLHRVGRGPRGVRVLRVLDWIRLVPRELRLESDGKTTEGKATKEVHKEVSCTEKIEALVHMHRCGTSSEEVRLAAIELGISLDNAKECGVAQYELRELKRAGVQKKVRKS